MSTPVPPNELPADGVRLSVIHIGEVAGVAAKLVKGLRDQGVHSQLRALPAPRPDSSLLLKGLSMWPRVSAAKEVRSELRLEDSIAHVHYATSGMLFAGTHPLVIHAHGTDVRDPSGLQSKILKRVFLAADLVLASTPDLIRWLPSNSVYLPNPVDTEMFCEYPEEPERDVLVFAALTDVKGAPQILEVVRALKKQRPGIGITAINHGPYVEQFKAEGVELVDFTAPEALPGLIANHRIVIGQRKLGVLGTSELQAMACARPVAIPLDASLHSSDFPPVINAGYARDAADEILRLLEAPLDLIAVGAASRDWVVKRHSVPEVSRQLVKLYDKLR
ncbi:MAG: glycosyltransferase family 4 protein [Microthrixaceae bacterium]